MLANVPYLNRLPVRETIVACIVIVAISGVMMAQGLSFGVRMMVEASCYAILALGLTIQWGYAGQFNAGVMGFVALGGFCAMTFSVPVNPRFWDSDLPAQLGSALLQGIVLLVLVIGLWNSYRLGVPRKLRTVVTIVVGLIAWLYFRSVFGEAATAVERQAGFIGGLGLPAWIGWIDWAKHWAQAA